MNTETPFLILSAERADLDPEVNAERTRQLFAQLAARRFAYVKVTGSYKGRTEASFLVLLDGGDGGYLFDMLLALARRYGQESVLSVDANRRATLHTLASGIGHTDTALGQWAPISAERAEHLDSWTRDGRGSYWSTL